MFIAPLKNFHLFGDAAKRSTYSSVNHVIHTASTIARFGLSLVSIELRVLLSSLHSILNRQRPLLSSISHEREVGCSVVLLTFKFVSFVFELMGSCRLGKVLSTNAIVDKTMNRIEMTATTYAYDHNSTFSTSACDIKIERAHYYTFPLIDYDHFNYITTILF